MLLVILGAGASYDSAPSKHPEESRHTNLQNRPPLASELFSDRPYFGEIMNKYPQCLPIISRLRNIPPESSVELQLQRLQSEATRYPERHRQLAAVRYYLQEILTVCPAQWLGETQSVSNYSTLIDDIRHWKEPEEKVCFVTFNYDKLLDEALNRAGYRFTELSAYVARDLMLIKLHGSVNWAREVATPCSGVGTLSGKAIADWVIENFPTLEISQNYTMSGSCPPSNSRTTALVPALAIPVESKLAFECPAAHVVALKNFLPTVSRMLMIGWRGMESHFLGLLKENLRGQPRNFVIGRDKHDAVSIIENLKKRHSVPGIYDIASGGFTDFIRRREIEPLLHR